MLETNDPKLTAYALGELSPGEQAQVAAQVAKSTTLQRDVAQIQQLGGVLETLLSQEPCPALVAAEREPILEAATAMVTTQKSTTSARKTLQLSSWITRHQKLWYASAALLLVGFTLLLLVIPLVMPVMAEPQYRAAAWLRVEDMYVIYGDYPENTSAPERMIAEGEPAPRGKVKEQVEPDQQVVSDATTLRVPISELYSRIEIKEVEQELLKARTQAMEEHLNSQEIEIDDEAVEAEALADKRVQQLTEEAAAQRRAMNQLLAASAKGTDDPRYQVKLQQNLETERKRNELLDELRESIRTKKIEAEQRRRTSVLAEARKQINSNQLEMDLLREKFFEQREYLTRKRGGSLDLIYKERELAREEKVVELISSRIMRLRTEMHTPAKVTLLRKAEPPTQPIPRSFFSLWSSETGAKEDELFDGNSGGSPIKHFLTSQMDSIRSPLVMEQVLTRPDVVSYGPLAKSPQPVAWLQSRTRVQTRSDSELFIIDFTCEDPEYAATIANAIVESYFRIQTQDEVQHATRVVDLLEDERSRRMVRIKSLREQLDEMKARIRESKGDAAIISD